jgi:hypothetical protein
MAANAPTVAFQDRSPGTLSQLTLYWSFTLRGHPRPTVTAETCCEVTVNPTASLKKAFTLVHLGESLSTGLRRLGCTDDFHAGRTHDPAARTLTRVRESRASRRRWFAKGRPNSGHRAGGSRLGGKLAGAPGARTKVYAACPRHMRPGDAAAPGAGAPEGAGAGAGAPEGDAWDGGGFAPNADSVGGEITTGLGLSEGGAAAEAGFAAGLAPVGGAAPVCCCCWPVLPRLTGACSGLFWRCEPRDVSTGADWVLGAMFLEGSEMEGGIGTVVGATIEGVSDPLLACRPTVGTMLENAICCFMFNGM